jgi:hypothetical protein
MSCNNSIIEKAMDDINLKELVQTLRESGKYCVLEKYQKPEHYHVDHNTPKLIGSVAFVDNEHASG